MTRYVNCRTLIWAIKRRIDVILAFSTFQIPLRLTHKLKCAAAVLARDLSDVKRPGIPREAITVGLEGILQPAEAAGSEQPFGNLCRALVRRYVRSLLEADLIHLRIGSIGPIFKSESGVPPRNLNDLAQPSAARVIRPHRHDAAELVAAPAVKCDHAHAGALLCNSICSSRASVAASLSLPLIVMDTPP